MSSTHPTVRLIALALVFTTACDCEDRVRQALSNEGDRKMKAPDAGAPSGPAEAEPNNSPESATKLSVGKELRPVRGTLADSGDVDWFELTVEDGVTSVEVTVTPETALDVSLHVDVDGSVPLSYDGTRRGDPESIPVLRVTPAGQRFAIRSEAESKGDYTISFKRHMATEGLESEPNDDTSVATEVLVPGEVQGRFDRPDDRDVYLLTGQPATPHVFEFVPPKGGRQIARFFRDPGLEEPLLTLQIVGDTPTEIPNVAMPADGKQWLVMTSVGSSKPTDGYRVRAVVHPEIDGTLEVEPNDQVPLELVFGEPGPSGRQAQVQGYIHSAEDVDRFLVSPPASEQPPATDEPNEPQQPAEAGEGEEPAVDLLAEYRDKPRPAVPVSARLTWTDNGSSYGMVWESQETGRIEFRRSSVDAEVLACGLKLDDGPAVLEVRPERFAQATKVGNPQYQLTVSETSSGDDWEAEPNNNRGIADVLDPARRGTFAGPGDTDMYAFAVEEGADPTAFRPVQVQARSSGADLLLQIYDATGGVVANADNGPVGAMEKISVDLPPGLYFAQLSWKGGTICAPYEISVSVSE